MYYVTGKCCTARLDLYQYIYENLTHFQLKRAISGFHVKTAEIRLRSRLVSEYNVEGFSLPEGVVVYYK